MCELQIKSHTNQLHPVCKQCYNKYTSRFEILKAMVMGRISSVVWWSGFLATDPEVLGSIPGSTRFSEK
jgi:hypothetical protein